MRRLALVALAIPLALVSLACVSSGGATGPSSAAAVAVNSPTIARIVERGELRVGMSGDQPPLNFRNKGGELAGLEVDLARGMAMMMGVEPTLVVRPFGELMGAIESGEVDLVISGMTITPARNMRVAFVGPYLLSGKSILTRSSTLAKVDETTDLDQADLKLAALAGSTSEDFVRAFLPKAQLSATVDYDTAIQMLLDDQVHAFVADYQVCVLHARLHEDAGLVTLERPLTVEPLGIAVAPGDSLFLNLIENNLGALESSLLLEGLRGRWLRSGVWVDELP